MQVILKKDVQNLGEAGEIITVKEGYARNYLLPHNLAEEATKGAIHNKEQNIARIKAKQEKLHAEALKIAEQIEKLGSIEIAAKAGESGKLFGTITTKRLAEEINEKLGTQIDRKSIIVNAPVNKVGSFVMSIKLTSKVKAELNILVNASEILKEEIEEQSEKQEEE